MNHLQQYHLLATAATILVVSFCRLTNHTEDWQVRNISCNSVTTSSVSSQFKNLNNHTRIVFTDCEAGQNLELQSDVFISEVNSLQIKGTRTNTINCTRENTALHFEGVSNLHLENLHILNCGTINETALRTGSVNIVNCSNVTVKGVTVEMSPNTGLTLVNNRGRVTVENCTFRNNGQMWKRLKHFVPFQTNNNTFVEFHARGGGVHVLVGASWKNSSLKITNCKFFKNSASYGGGLFIIIQEVTVDMQRISVLNSTFNNNKCHRGGGGLQIGFNINAHIDTHEDTLANTMVKINIENCTFSSNEAKYGGGVDIFSTLTSFLFPPDTLTFIRCNWINNSAVLGLAIDIAIATDETFTDSIHSHLPSPVFTDCSFVENKDKSIFGLSGAVHIVNKPRSVFYVTGFRIEFQEKTVFQGNLGTAIEATSSVLNFQANSDVYFSDNQGIEGGAMNLKASTLYFHDNSSFIFENNTAVLSGGAIYAQFVDKHSLFMSKNCFIQYKGVQENPSNVTFKFINNSAAAFPNRDASPETKTSLRHRGDSFWATSLSPCIEKCTKSLTFETAPVKRVLECFGNVTIDRLDPERRQFSTAANHFVSTNISNGQDSMCLVLVNLANDTIKMNPNYDPVETNLHKETLHFIPGYNTKVPLRLVDDFCAEVFFLVRVEVIYSERCMFVHQAHSVITDNHLALYGEQNQSGLVQLTTLGIRAVSATINVFMDECPPGFVYSYKTKACVCSADEDNTTYFGIYRCNESAAFVQHGYWVGYLDENKNESTLASSLCPKGFCTNVTKSKQEHQLPFSTSEDISIYICDINRTGLVCGKCKDNYSVHYHSMTFACKSNDLCHLGWLFYILSELIPVTLFFLVVIALNISFTSGPLNGVIFFMQVVDTLKIKAENFIWFDKVVYQFGYIYKLVYRMFSLNFFSLSPFSFCLWQDASALDLLTFRYITIVYSLLLIIGTVVLLKLCNFKLFNKYVISVKGSMIHGLSAFLVMSYSECTRVSLMLVTRGTFRIGPNNPHKRYFAFYNGEFSYMEGEHLKYALPAIFFIITLVSIPPLLLISYPLCYKLFALLGLEESRFVQIMCKILPLEKIKPLFDSIQGAFKDRYRFFAGLYFIYRLSSLVTFAMGGTLITHYTLTGFQFSCMLLIHAVCRPYKKPWHNVLDAFLFFNLFLINGLAYFNYSLASHKKIFTISPDITLQVVAAFQTGLILLPLVYLIIYTTSYIVLKLKAMRVCKKYSSNSTNEVDASYMLYAIDAMRTDDS